MDRRVVVRVVLGAAAAACVGLAAAWPAQAAAPTTLSTALSKDCKKAQAKAIAAEAANPTNNGTKEQATYLRKCPGADYLEVRSIGSISAVTQIPGPGNKPVAVKKVTSSNPKVVALGKPGEAVPQQVVGIGQSRVCMTPASGKAFCLLVVVPKKISGGTNGRTLNVGLATEGTPQTATTITSSNPAVVTVNTDPTSGHPYTSPAGPGTTTVCAKFTKGPGGCQEWTVTS